MTTFVQIAGCVGPSLYTGVMASGQGSALAGGASAAQAAADGFALAMTVAAAIAALGFSLSLVYARAARTRARAQAAERAAAPQSVLAELMESNPYTLPASASVGEAMRMFVELKVGGLPLVDDAGRPAGFVSDGDVMRYLADKHPVITGAYSLMEAARSQTFDERLRELMALPAGTIATQRLVALDADATLEEACALLATAPSEEGAGGARGRHRGHRQPLRRAALRHARLHGRGVGVAGRGWRARVSRLAAGFTPVGEPSFPKREDDGSEPFEPPAGGARKEHPWHLRPRKEARR